MNLNEFAQRIWAWLNEFVFTPVTAFYGGLDPSDRTVLYVLLLTAAAVGFVLGRRRLVRSLRRRFPRFQNAGEALVSRVLASQFGPPDYHLMNHVTLQMDDGTTQVDHILLSKFGVFVIETKHYKGWLFANAADAVWTQVLFRARFTFQNPILQNRRHVRAVRELLDFLPPETVKSVVVFSGDAEFKTEIPEGVVEIDRLTEYLQGWTSQVMSQNHLQLCVGRLETARLAISGETDVEHMRSLARRHGGLTSHQG